MSSSHELSDTQIKTAPTTPPYSAGLISNMPSSLTGSEEAQVSMSRSQDTPVSMNASRDGERELQRSEAEDTHMSEAGDADHRRTDHERNLPKMGELSLLCQIRKTHLPTYIPAVVLNTNDPMQRTLAPNHTSPKISSVSTDSHASLRQSPAKTL